MLTGGLLLLGLGFALLNWCSVGLGRANPGQRVPGRLPVVQHPGGYMPVGSLGFLLVIGGSALCRGSADLGAWLIAAATIAVALVGPFLVHNRRLPR